MRTSLIRYWRFCCYLNTPLTVKPLLLGSMTPAQYRETTIKRHRLRKEDWVAKFKSVDIIAVESPVTAGGSGCVVDASTVKDVQCYCIAALSFTEPGESGNDAT